MFIIIIIIITIYNYNKLLLLLFCYYIIIIIINNDDERFKFDGRIISLYVSVLLVCVYVLYKYRKKKTNWTNERTNEE